MRRDNMTEILFEFVRSGSYMKVTAIETETQTEATVVVPATLTEEQMKFQALNKFKYLLKKKEKE